MRMRESQATLQKTRGTQFAVSRLRASPETAMVSVRPILLPGGDEPVLTGHASTAVDTMSF